jgi:hypothetical protein
MVMSSSFDRVPRPRALALRAVASAALLATTVVADVAAPSSARADSARLAEARRALDEVRYDKAQELLGAALRDGDNAPETMVEIYALAASTAIVLGKEELGELYYRRLLSLDPDADLEAGLAPKFKRAFTAAQAYVSAQGALRVRTRRRPEGVAVAVESDPLAMVAAVSLRGAKGRARLDPERRALLPLAADRHGDDERVLLLDEHGNRLRALPVPELEGSGAPQLSADGPARGERAEGGEAPSALRTWWIWTIPSAVALGVGIGFGVQSRAAADELDELLAGPSPYYDEASALRSRSHRYATVANVSFAAAGAFAVVAGIMLATRPEAKPAATASGPSLVPAFGRDGSVGLVLTGNL